MRHRNLIALTLAVTLAFPTWVWAAIAYEGTVTNSVSNAGQATITTSATVGAIANGMMAVCTHTVDSEAGTQFVTGITFDGVAFTAQDEGIGSAATNHYTSQLFHLVAPNVGTHNVVVTWNSTNTIGQAYSIHVFSGVDQASPVDATAADASDTGTTADVSITTVAANAWVLDCLTTQDGTAVTQGAGQTEKEDRQTNGAPLGRSASSVVEGKASPGAELMDWTVTAGKSSIAAVSFKPAAAGGATCRGALLLMGVGGC